MVKTNNSVPNGRTKEKSEKTNIGARGGSTKMFGPQDASPSNSGTSSPANSRIPPDNKFGIKNNAGKTGVMGKQRGAAPAVSGQVSPGGRAGDNSFKVSGGKGHMAGFSPAANAKAR